MFKSKYKLPKRVCESVSQNIVDISTPKIVDISTQKIVDISTPKPHKWHPALPCSLCTELWECDALDVLNGYHVCVLKMVTTFFCNHY